MRAFEGTKLKALREAKGLLQRFGFNGFSFQHVADRLGIQKPSLFDHFKSKDDLGLALIKDYQESFTQWSETIADFSPKDKIGAYFELFSKYSAEGKKFCPLVAMISDFNSLSKPIKRQLLKNFIFQNNWLKETISQGQKNGLFRKDRKSSDLAKLVISIGLGSQLIARVTENSRSIKEMKEKSFKLLEAK